MMNVTIIQNHKQLLKKNMMIGNHVVNSANVVKSNYCEI